MIAEHIDATKDAKAHADTRVREAEGRALSVEINSKQAVRTERQVAFERLAAERETAATRRAAEVERHASKQRRTEEHAAGTRKEEERAAANAAGVLLTLVCAKAESAEVRSSQAKSRASYLQTDLQAAKRELGSTIDVLVDRERELESGQEYHAAQILSYEKEKASTATKLESTNKEIKV